VKGTIPQKNETWDQLRQHTIKIVRRELNSTKKTIREKIITATSMPSKPIRCANLKPIPAKPYVASTAPEYLKALRKQFFNAGGKKKKTSKSKQRRKAKRMAERFARLPAD
jgi:hypothetical protein